MAKIYPDGCKRSNFYVYPKNWKSTRASVKKKWEIFYRYYDPQFKGTEKWGLLIRIREMNQEASLRGRQRMTEDLLLAEDELLDEGFNPVTREYKQRTSEREIQEVIVGPETPFIVALYRAVETLEAEEKTKKDVRNCLTYIRKVAIALRIDSVLISKITRGHIKSILNFFATHKLYSDQGRLKKWNANQHNHYLKYLSILFNELDEHNAIEEFPCAKIRRKKVTKKIRETLTRSQRKFLSEYLPEKHYDYWRFIQIFFHSGARETELTKVKIKDVDIENQRFKVVVKKTGGDYEEVWKPIKNSVLPYWKEVIRTPRSIGRGKMKKWFMPTPEDYIFSRGLIPGPTSIRPDQITKRWLRIVKKPFGITADVYSLKHLNTTEQINELAKVRSIDEAKKLVAQHNSHKSTKMIDEHYDTEKRRRNDEAADLIKQLGNSF